MAGAAKTGANKNSNTLRVRKLNGKVVRPVLYNGRAIGHGSYLAGEVDNQLVMDGDRPLPLREIGTLERY